MPAGEKKCNNHKNKRSIYPERTRGACRPARVSAPAWLAKERQQAGQERGLVLEEEGVAGVGVGHQLGPRIRKAAMPAPSRSSPASQCLTATPWAEMTAALAW
jgi:hypothetical protein